MTTMKQDPLILGAVLVVAAMLYSRQANASTKTTAKPGGTGSVPSNVGAGAKQIVGGVVGSLFNLFTQTPVVSNPAPGTIQPGTGYDPSDPAFVGGIQSLINGTASDYATGDRSSYETPSINDIVTDVANSTYGGDGFASDTVIRNPNAYW